MFGCSGPPFATCTAPFCTMAPRTHLNTNITPTQESLAGDLAHSRHKKVGLGISLIDHFCPQLPASIRAFQGTTRLVPRSVTVNK